MMRKNYERGLHFYILYIALIISIFINIISNNNIKIGKKTELIKPMDETTEVLNLNNTINTLQASHTEYSNYIQASKINLATAITNAGVTTSEDDTFETMITNVSNILSNTTNDATATEEQILTGQTAWVKGNKVTGTMVNHNAVTPTALNAGGSYTIPEGYHNGSGKVTAAALSGQTSGTATEAQILKGKKAWVNGTQLTGTMTDRGAWTNTPTASGKVTIPEGYHNGSGHVDTSNVYTAGYNAGISSSSFTGFTRIWGESSSSASSTISTSYTFTKDADVAIIYANSTSISKASGSGTLSTLATANYNGLYQILQPKAGLKINITRTYSWPNATIYVKY